MHPVGPPPWMMRVQCPYRLMIGLFVRDAAGLNPPAAIDLPRLVPDVELRASLAPLAVPAASEQWARWWRRELARQEGPERGFAVPDARYGDGEELDALVHACLDDARRWSADRKREVSEAHLSSGYPDVESELVRAVEEEVGREARPFRLDITELPVAGTAGWRVSEGHVVVSHALRTDAAAYREWLAPVVRDLV